MSAHGPRISKVDRAQGVDGYRCETERSSSATNRYVADLFERHGRTVLGLCRMHLRDAHEAEDAMQQVFLSAYSGLLTGTEPREPAAWLATIARNECLARSKRRARERHLAAAVDGASPASDPVDAASRRADLRHLCSAIVDLPQQQRDALLMREFSGMSYDELARELGVTGSAVESLLVRARRGLRTQLRPVLATLSVLPVAALRGLAGLKASASSSLADAVSRIAALSGPKFAAGAVGLLLVGGVGTVELQRQIGRAITASAAIVRPAAGDPRSAPSPEPAGTPAPAHPVREGVRHPAAAPRPRQVLALPSGVVSVRSTTRPPSRAFSTQAPQAPTSPAPAEPASGNTTPPSPPASSSASGPQGQTSPTGAVPPSTGAPEDGGGSSQPGTDPSGSTPDNGSADNGSSDSGSSDSGSSDSGSSGDGSSPPTGSPAGDPGSSPPGDPGSPPGDSAPSPDGSGSSGSGPDTGTTPGS